MPIRIAVIAPVSHLSQYVPYSDNIAMALTHLVLTDEQYADYYKRLREEHGYYVILDNSAFEMEQQGKGLDPEPVLRAAQQINASEVICTDVLCDYWATVQSTQNFISEYQKIWPQGPDSGGPRLQAVVQGSTKEEWWTCYDTLRMTPEVHVLGFSKVSIPHCFHGNREDSGCVTQARLKVTQTIEQDESLWPILQGKTIHLLGGDNWSPYELSVQTKYRWIRSNDTSMPIWYGRHGQTVDGHTGKLDEIITEKPDLENLDPETAIECTRNDVSILHNIAMLQKFSKWNPEV